VGLVFASRRTWIDTDHVYRLLEDDEYRRVDRLNVRVGDLVVYSSRGSIDHIGIAIDVQSTLGGSDRIITVLSQWGKDGEYLHREDVVPPLFGTERFYYTERKLV